MKYEKANPDYTGYGYKEEFDNEPWFEQQDKDIDWQKLEEEKNETAHT